MDDPLIRPIRPEDAEAINVIRRQPEVMRFTFVLPSERVEENRKFIENLGRTTTYWWRRRMGWSLQ